MRQNLLFHLWVELSNPILVSVQYHKSIYFEHDKLIQERGGQGYSQLETSKLCQLLYQYPRVL